MEVRVESVRTIKPIYDGNSPSTSAYIPLSVFDKVTYSINVGIVYAYLPPTPLNATIEYGLQKALSEYREFAGRLGENEKGDPVIFLNDKGVKFIEASVDSELDSVMPSQPSRLSFSLHPRLEDVEELLQVQLTRFNCGSLTMGLTTHHLVADGHAHNNFLFAWAKTCSGLDMGPRPLHDRTIFTPRNPPVFEFEHKEYVSKNLIQNSPNVDHNIVDDNVIDYKSHFTFDFVNKIKASASSLLDTNSSKPYSTFVSVIAHIWRAVTKARGMSNSEKTYFKIAVNGRTRVKPQVPSEYFGNFVLWAYPTAKVEDLLNNPLSYAAKIMHDAIANVNDNYFKSFIDFATHKVEKEDLFPVARVEGCTTFWPNLDVVSWLNFPFYSLDFGGGGSPYKFLPPYFPLEGAVLIVPSLTGDGSIDVFTHLYEENVASFEQYCYSLD